MKRNLPIPCRPVASAEMLPLLGCTASAFVPSPVVATPPFQPRACCAMSKLSCCAVETYWPPLSILRRLAGTDASIMHQVEVFEQESTRDPAPVACFLPPPGYNPASMGMDADSLRQPQRKYCKYDEIRRTLAASRARSKEQGRKGCCGKAADHLGNLDRQQIVRGRGYSERFSREG